MTPCYVLFAHENYNKRIADIMLVFRLSQLVRIGSLSKVGAVSGYFALLADPILTPVD